MEPFDYLVIIDFEATCDNGEKPKITRENQEIIEFPWIVLRLSDNKIIYKDQCYIRPVLTTELTSFCSALTGITSTQVESAPTLQEVLKKFDEFLKLLEVDQIPTQEKEQKDENKKADPQKEKNLLSLQFGINILIFVKNLRKNIQDLKILKFH